MSTPLGQNFNSSKDAPRVTAEELISLVQQRAEAVRSLSARLLRVQDEERRHLARELHDTTGQTLTALKLHLTNLQKRARTSPITTEDFSQLSELAEQALRDIRTTSYLLFPPLLDDVGFCSAAKWYVEGFARRSNIDVRLGLTCTDRLPQLIEIAFFRVLQESLANIYRHSGSSVADVRTYRNPDGFVLEIQDYGSGIPARLLEQFKRAGTGNGVGLGGMRERMEDFGGRFEIISRSSGTLVRAIVRTENLDSTSNEKLELGEKAAA
jgi:signal transduction histidine kinase